MQSWMYVTFSWSVTILLMCLKLSLPWQLLIANSSSAWGETLCLLHARLWSELGLHGACACCHKCCEFMLVF